MKLTVEEERILAGRQGLAKKKAIELLVKIGDLYGAERLIPISRGHVLTSLINFHDAGIQVVEGFSKAGGKYSVPTTIDPVSMSFEGTDFELAEDLVTKQRRIMRAHQEMDVIPTWTCTPYLYENVPRFGEHIAWAESSAVTFANSVIGARSNREGGPSALASAFTGKTPEYGFHLDAERVPNVHIDVQTKIRTLPDFGALGYAIGKAASNQIPYITGIEKASLDQLKSLSASIVTYGAKPLFHIKGLTPEAHEHEVPKQKITITGAEIKQAYDAINDPVEDIEFVCIGCPHASINEIAEIASLLKGKKVKAETWVATSRTAKQLADSRGYSKIIEESGAKYACDTCLAVAPLKGRFKSVATTSAKGCFYSRGSNAMKTKMGTPEECIDSAVTGKWRS